MLITFCVHTEHAMSTSLAGVGQQVWRGALLMCDYILSHMDSLSGEAVLELGAGTGLVSLVSALTASQVFCTGMKYSMHTHYSRIVYSC